MVWGPSSQFIQADSVDADDGLIDGDGSEGRSLRGAVAFIGGSSVTDAVRLEFDRQALGGLPSEFGFVLTDTGTGGQFAFQAFDSRGDVVGEIGGPFLGDGAIFGETDEDRFFGITHSAGIGSAIVALSGPLDQLQQLEIDHVQYGAIVPEPSSVLLFGVGLIVMSSRSIPRAS